MTVTNNITVISITIFYNLFKYENVNALVVLRPK